MRLVRRRFLQLAPVVLAAPLVSRLARAQAYPSRPVRVIVTTGPGGQGDTTARLIAQKLSENLGQSFYVENVVGGGGNIAHGVAARAAPDGHTILAAGGAFVANPSLYAKIPYDPHKDFAPITLVCSSTHVLAVHPSVPAHSVGELVAVARANPGTLSYASAGRGTPAHLAGELFKLAFAADITHVPFNGGGPGVTAAVGGHVPITVSALPTALPHAKAGSVAGARADERQAVLASARRADHGGGHRAAARSRHPDRPARAGRHAEGDHRSAAIARSPRSSRCRSSGSASWRSASSRSPARPMSSPTGSRRKSRSGRKSSATRISACSDTEEFPETVVPAQVGTHDAAERVAG